MKRFNFGLAAISVAQKKANDWNAQLIDTLLMILAGFNSATDAELMALCDVIGGSKYGKNGINHEVNLIKGDIAHRNKKMIETLHDASDGGYDSMHRSNEQIVCAMADALDSSDDVVNEYIGKMKALIDKKLPKMGEGAPAEPYILRQLLLLEILCSTAEQLYDKVLFLMPLLAQYPFYSWMSYKITNGRFRKIRTNIKLMNKYGRPLHCNTEPIITGPEMMGKKSENGTWQDGLLPSLRDAIFSTRYIDRLYIARDGKDPHFRDNADSLLEGIHGVKNIALQ